MSKKNTFFGATISYATISTYYSQQGIFSCFVIQAMMNDATKANDDYIIALWAVNKDGEVMNGAEPIVLPPNSHSIPAKNKVHFANVYLTKAQLNDLYKTSTFDLGLNPIEYTENKEYVSFEIFNAKDEAFTALTTINPSPPATHS